MLPGEGDVFNLRIFRALKEELALTEEEHVLLAPRKDPETGRVMWNKEAETEKEVAINPIAMSFIVKTLTDLEEKKKMIELYLGIYEKFVENILPEAKK